MVPDINMFGVGMVHGVLGKKQCAMVVNEEVGGVGGALTKLVE